MLQRPVFPDPPPTYSRMLSGFGRQAPAISCGPIPRPFPMSVQTTHRHKEGVTFFIDFCQLQKKPLLVPMQFNRDREGLGWVYNHKNQKFLRPNAGITFPSK